MKFTATIYSYSGSKSATFEADTIHGAKLKATRLFCGGNHLEDDMLTVECENDGLSVALYRFYRYNRKAGKHAWNKWLDCTHRVEEAEAAEDTEEQTENPTTVETVAETSDGNAQESTSVTEATPSIVLERDAYGDMAKVMVPAGTYCLGDPCLKFGMEEWGVEVNSSRCLRNPTDRIAVAFFTANGDGEYEDDIGNRYCVDSGTIGLVSTDDIGDSDTTVTFRHRTMCYNDGGVMHFGGRVIDTSHNLEGDGDRYVC